MRKDGDAKLSVLDKILTSLRSDSMSNEELMNESKMNEGSDGINEKRLKEKRDLLDEEADDIVLLLRKALKNLLNTGSLSMTTTKASELSTNKMLKITNMPEVLMATTPSPMATESNTKSLGEQIGSNKFVKFLKMTIDTLFSEEKNIN